MALGNFDGIHQGHCKVIHSLLNAKVDADRCFSTVVAFDPHPQEFFTGHPRPLLTPASEKAELLAQLGVVAVIVVAF